MVSIKSIRDSKIKIKNLTNYGQNWPTELLIVPEALSEEGNVQHTMNVYVGLPKPSLPRLETGLVGSGSTLNTDETLEGH